MDKKLPFFLFKFFALFLALQFLLLTIPLMPLESFIAGVEGKALNINYVENKVFVNDGVFSIDSNCSGLFSGIILASIVFSLRKPALKTKLLLFFLGFSVLFLSNFLRIYAVLWAGMVFGIAVADLVHTISWFTTSALIILLWYYLTKKIAKVKQFNELV